MELITTHTHTCFTNHGEGTVEELVSAAVAAGVSTIAVTEHYPMTATFDPDRYLSMPAERLGEYLAAVAAARAVDAGHEVVGVHMALTRNRAQTRSGSRGCCSIEDSADARWAAQILGIPFYVWDLSEEFEERVVADFLDEYRAGRTPNPCVRCNERV